MFLETLKAPEELYDFRNDPHQLVNLAENPEYAATLSEVRVHLSDWQSSHDDLGLNDYRTRTVNASKAGDVLDWLKENDPDGWQNLLDGNIGEN